MTTNKPIVSGIPLEVRSKLVLGVPCAGVSLSGYRTKLPLSEGSGRRWCQGGCWCPARLIVPSLVCRVMPKVNLTAVEGEHCQ